VKCLAGIHPQEAKVTGEKDRRVVTRLVHFVNPSKPLSRRNARRPDGDEDEDEDDDDWQD